MVTTTFFYTAGLDLGNGYVKGLIQPHSGTSAGPIGEVEVVDLPSAVGTASGLYKMPVSERDAVDHVHGDPVSGVDFFNSVDVSIDSPAASDVSGYRCRLGSSGLDNTDNSSDVMQFTIGDGASKANQSISPILCLGVVAAKAVKDYVIANSALPDKTLDVTVVAAMALPIDEYVTNRGSYAQVFTGENGDLSHMVTVNNFNKPVHVCIRFAKVTVIAEGASAQFAISQYDDAVLQGMLDDAKSHYEQLAEYEVEDLRESRNIVGIDIGEGTVNFPVYRNRNFSPDISRTLYAGYGNQLDAALDELKGINTRKALSELLVKDNQMLAERGRLPRVRQERYTEIQQKLHKHERYFSTIIAREFNEIMKRIGADVDVVYVYGGGSGPMRELLYPALIETAQQALGGEDSIIPPIIYLDASYSRNLNRSGLMIAANKTADVVYDKKRRRAKN